MKNHLLTLTTYSTCCYGSLQKSLYSDAIFAYKEKVLINITCYLNFCCFPKSFIMNLVSSVDSFSPLDQDNKDDIFNLFVTLYNLYLNVLFLSSFPSQRKSFSSVHKRGGEDIDG